MKLFERKNIIAPGRINDFLDGRFQEFNIDDLNNNQLQQLYERGCLYIQPTKEGRKVINSLEHDIVIKPLLLK